METCGNLILEMYYEENKKKNRMKRRETIQALLRSVFVG